MIWFVIWILLAGLGCYLATERGRSPVTWGILGFLFGPLAIGMLLIFGDSDKIFKCPKCFGKCDSRATVCMHCRHEFPKSSPVTEVPWTDSSKENQETVELMKKING